MKMFLALISLIIFLPREQAQAEPWMANRFAENCSSCHAPGRLDIKPSKRRCTLSCQGCHVNPNGGGLRNSHGQWNSERWARSFYTQLLWNKPSPAPLDKQHYSAPDLSQAKEEAFAKKGANLVGFAGVVKNDKPYRENKNAEVAEDEVDFMAQIPRNDPYRLDQSNQFDVGGDLRFFYIKQGKGPASSKLEQGTFYPMAFDFALRARPTRKHLSFVYEGRAFNSSLQNPSSMDRLFGSSGAAFTRSAYLLVDDLWYNSYMQAGYFRPMFGSYNPNHNAMITDYTQLGVFTRIKGIGIGAAPGIPFVIVNMIMPNEGEAIPTGASAPTHIYGESGINFAVGMRWVPYGMSLVGSYWATKNNQGTMQRERTMWNLNASGAIGRFILNGEMTSVQRVVAGLDETKIVSVDAKYRFFREMYLMVGYAKANAAVARLNTTSLTAISPGTGSEMSFGLKMFTIAGLETEILWNSKENKEENRPATIEETMAFQVHAFF